MSHYQLTASSHADLVAIAQYTYEMWGDEQVEVYKTKFKTCFDSIARVEVVARRFHKAYPELLVVRCEHHMIFYLQTTLGEPVPIIAILHARMNLLTRIKSRISS